MLPGGTRVVQLIVEYDGAAFWGSQRQANVRTVQGCLEESFGRFTGEEVRVLMASRTDKGVHARGQCAAVRTACALEGPELVRSLNSYLPEDLVARSAQHHEIPESFHPRVNTGKWYRYVCSVGQVRPAIDRHTAWHVPCEVLDMEAMRDAALQLVGEERDFTSFTNKDKGKEPENPLCRFDELRVTTPSQDRVHFDFMGNRFLYNMIRIITGTLVAVGRGRLKAQDLAAILEAKDRQRAPAGAPANGLTLMEIFYESRESPSVSRQGPNLGTSTSTADADGPPPAAGAAGGGAAGAGGDNGALTALPPPSPPPPVR